MEVGELDFLMSASLPSVLPKFEEAAEVSLTALRL